MPKLTANQTAALAQFAEFPTLRTTSSPKNAGKPGWVHDQTARSLVRMGLAVWTSSLWAIGPVQ